MAKISVLDQSVSLYSIREEDYISLTDIARYKNQDRTDDLIRNWLRNRNTLEFLGIWEHLNNPDFNPVEFDGIKMQAGLNTFTLTPKQWIKKTKAIGLISKAGRYGGTYAHKDIAFEFASWVSVEFKLYLIKEFQLVCLYNLENLNALFIADGLSQKERLKRLNKIAIHQMTLLTSDERMQLPGGDE